MKLRSLLIALVAAGTFASAAQAAGNTIAVINIQEIMHDSTAAKSVKDQLEAKQKIFQAEMSKKEEDLQKEDQDLAKQRSVLSPEAFDKKLKDFKVKATAAQREVQEKHGELDNALSGALADIQKAVYDIVSTMAKEKGYTMVMPSSQLVYADTSLDITQEVLTKLNAKLPKLTVNFKAPAAKSDE